MANRRPIAAGRAKPSTRADAAEKADKAERAGPQGRGDGRRVPATLRAAAALSAVEAVAAVGFGTWLALESLVQAPRGLAIAVGTGVFVVAVGVGLGVLGWGLFRARHWSRGLTVVLQLLMLPIGYELTSAPTTLVGIGMLVAALATLALVLAPVSTAALRD
ncbi:hypothetical protein ABN028_08540 [Actinopolymorpha sp. B17G11]|uniref:hypothetical protein n=1 Tax=Actinopolymorpha sp. B17G11 TaxID=3160861 RepID=UPI0032E51004